MGLVSDIFIIYNGVVIFSRNSGQKLDEQIFGAYITAIDQFSNQSTGRLARLDCTDATGQMTGVAWDDLSGANPIYDITRMNLLMNDMVGEDISYGFVGPSTAWALDNNERIAGVEKYHFDTTKTLIGKTIKNVTMKKVMGQTYKSNSADSGKIGYPGLGSYDIDTWSDRKKIPMMRTDSGTKEWALFCAGDVGNVLTARTHKDHTNTNTPYVHSWDEKEFGFTYSTLQLGFTPAVKDFGRMIVVKNIAGALGTVTSF